MSIEHRSKEAELNQGMGTNYRYLKYYIMYFYQINEWVENYKKNIRGFWRKRERIRWRGGIRHNVVYRRFKKVLRYIRV